ncbi:MAG: glycosyltransferase family 4 protein [Burkholderiaceae bacterium]
MDRVPTARRIGLLVKIFPKLSETFILEEVLGLERQGLALRLYTLADPTDPVAHADVARVRASVVRVPARLRDDLPGFMRHHAVVALRHPQRWATSLLRAVRGGRDAMALFVRAGWLAGRLHDDGVDHLHAHFIAWPADLAAAVSALTGLPFSISAHAKDIYLSSERDLRRRLEAARFTVTCTEFNARTLADIAPRAAVHRMYHGVDACVFHPRHRRARSLVPLVLSVGRLRAKKGFDTLIGACALLRDAGRPFRCEIVGYGEEHDRLAARIAALALADHVQLAGRLTREQVVERYARAAVYVQPSRVSADGDRDGIPNVLLEAMAMALPVVATRVSGIPELVQHDHNGCLVDPDAPHELADALVRLIDDRALADRLGATARLTVTQRFDNDHNLRQLMQLLDLHDERALALTSRAAA